MLPRGLVLCSLVGTLQSAAAKGVSCRSCYAVLYNFFFFEEEAVLYNQTRDIEASEISELLWWPLGLLW
jgi:hypothetical protein